MLGVAMKLGDASDEDLRAGTLLALHGMEYLGGGWDAAMVVVRERIAIMELLKPKGPSGGVASKMTSSTICRSCA